MASEASTSFDWLNTSLPYIGIPERDVAIHDGDCISFMESMGPESVDLIVTDPPYIMEYQTNHRKTKGAEEGSREELLQRKIKTDTDPAIIRRYMKRANLILKPGGAIYCFSKVDRPDGFDLLGFFKQQIREAGFQVRNTIIWMKDNWTAGDLEGAFGFQYEVIIFAAKEGHKIRGHRWPDIWQCPRVPDAQRVHPNQKPTALLSKAIGASSDPGDIVFDGFGGSGSTAVAAGLMGRKSVICENDSPRIPSLIENIRKGLRVNSMIGKPDAKSGTDLFQLLG